MHIYYEPKQDKITREDAENYVFAKVTHDSQSTYYFMTPDEKGDYFAHEMLQHHCFETEQFNWGDVSDEKITIDEACGLGDVSITYYGKEDILDQDYSPFIIEGGEEDDDE